MLVQTAAPLEGMSIPAACGFMTRTRAFARPTDCTTDGPHRWSTEPSDGSSMLHWQAFLLLIAITSITLPVVQLIGYHHLKSSQLDRYLAAIPQPVQSRSAQARASLLDYSRSVDPELGNPNVAQAQHLQTASELCCCSQCILTAH